LLFPLPCCGAPDTLVTSFGFEREGGSKGLFGGHNGKNFNAKPLLRVKCKGKAKKARCRHRRG